MKKGQPTALNLWVLKEVFGACDEVPNRFPHTRIPHLKRCIAAGLCEAHGDSLRLTQAGKDAIKTVTH